MHQGAGDERRFFRVVQVSFPIPQALSERVRWRGEIDLSDGGAQEGSLTFYSKQALKAAGSENCEIVSVKDLGDDIWQVNLTGRQWGTAQSLALTIQ